MLCRSLLPAAMLWVAWFAADATAEPPLGQIEHKSEVLCAAWSYDGKTLATGCQDGTIRLSDATGKEVRTIAIGPGAKLIAVGSTDKTVHLWDYSKRQKIGALTGLPDGAVKLCFSADGSTLAGLSADGGVLRVWDVNRNRTRRQMTSLRG